MTPETVTSAPAPAKRTKTLGRPKGRTTTMRDTDHIVLTGADMRPKRGDAARRFALYDEPQTVASYVGLVGNRTQALRDIAWDLRHKLIRLEPADEPAQAA